MEAAGRSCGDQKGNPLVGSISVSKVMCSSAAGGREGGREERDEGRKGGREEI